MVVQQAPVRPDRHQAVVECTPPGAALDALAEPQDDGRPRFAGGGGQMIERGTGNGHAVLRDPGIDRFHRRVIPERRVAAQVEPRRIAGYPGLREHDQLGARGRSLQRLRAGQIEPAGNIFRNLGLDDGGHDLLVSHSDQARCSRRSNTS